MAAATGTDLGVASQESVGDGHSQVKVYSTEYVSLHTYKLGSVVGVVTYIQEVIDERWYPLLYQQQMSYKLHAHGNV